MNVDLNPAYTRHTNPRLDELVAAARGRTHGGHGAPPDPAQPTTAGQPAPHISRTPADYDPDVARLHAQGLSDADIARQARISSKQVWYARKRLNLPSNGRSADATRRFEADVRRLWEENLNDQDIAAALGTERRAVGAARRRLRLTTLHSPILGPKEETA